jgi:phenylpropionate dioxygenase-like ring-hydroxylating dioxygenase large terminal subunit
MSSPTRSGFLWNYWYTACASSQLTREPRAVRLLGESLVLFRDTSGAPSALRDKCCHRGYKLSLGSVSEGRLHCGFHNWAYAPDGRVVDVPSLCSGSRIPDACRVPSFRCIEKDGYVWVWMGKDRSEPTCEPAIPGFAGRPWVQGSGAIGCDVTRSIEINLDPAHIYYVHPSHPATIAFQQGGGVFEDSRQELRLTEQGLVVFWPPAPSLDAPIPRDSFRIYFDLPNVVRFENAGEGRSLILFFVPTDERSCRMDFLMTQPHRSDDRVVWIDTVPEILEQDRAVLEVLQQAGDCDDIVERSVEADTAALVARKIIRMAQSGAWTASGAGVERSRIIHSRAAGPKARSILMEGTARS